MAEEAKKSKPPYVPFGTFMNFVNGLAEGGIPTHIDKSLMPKLSGGTQSILIISLKSLGFIKEDGRPTDNLELFCVANESEKRQILLESLKKGFAALFESEVDLGRITPHKFDDALRKEYDLSSSTLDKTASFFLSAAEYCHLPLSSHLKARKPTFKRSIKIKRIKEDEDDFSVAAPDNSGDIRSSKNLEIKPLEYQLIDLMSEPDIEDPVKESIWALVQYLAKRKIKTQSP